MKLIAYLTEGHHLDIRPAPADRPWMDATDQRFAYRCLPLNIANAHGWEILSPTGFVAAWNGSTALDGMQVIPDDPALGAPALSHFGHGILTFHVPCLFRTEPGFDLIAQGPVNRPKDGVAALTGVIETDWAPYTFTMNWIFTRPGIAVRFEKGEPFCHIFPVRRSDIESAEPVIVPMASDPQTEAQFKAWSASRLTFNADLKREGSQAREEGWQKVYYRGLAPDQPARTRVRLKPFRED